MIRYDSTVEDMGPNEIKEANRLMWMVKGQLIPLEYSDKDINSVLKGYFKRLWGNHERSQYAEEGFEDAWEHSIRTKSDWHKWVKNRESNG